MAVREIKQPTKLGNRLTAQDASFLYGESFGGPTHIGLLSFFEGEIAYERLYQHFEQRLHLLPRYTQRLALVPFNLAHASLEDDPNFNLANHVKFHQLPAGTSEADLIKAAVQIFEPPLSRTQPLWQIHAFTGLEGGRTGVLWKIHHCLVDGVSAMELTTVAFDFRPDAPPPEPPPEKPRTPRPVPSLAENLLNAIQDLMDAQVNAAWRAQEMLRKPKELAEQTKQLSEAAQALSQMMARPIVAAPWNIGLCSQHRSFARAHYSFAEFRAIRNALGGTINDLVLTMLSEAAARYLKQHDCKPRNLLLRIGCPVNVRREDQHGTLGNRVSMMFPELPAVPMDLVKRMEAVKQETERIKTERLPQGLELLSEATSVFPPSIIGVTSSLATFSLDAAMMMSRLAPSIPATGVPGFGINFVATNVPGVQTPQYLAGHLMIDQVGLIPCAGSLGYGVAITTYNQNIDFGLMAEPTMMPDVNLMKSLLDEVFAEFYQTAQRVIQQPVPPCGDSSTRALRARITRLSAHQETSPR